MQMNDSRLQKATHPGRQCRPPLHWKWRGYKESIEKRVASSSGAGESNSKAIGQAQRGVVDQGEVIGLVAVGAALEQAVAGPHLPLVTDVVAQRQQHILGPAAGARQGIAFKAQHQVGMQGPVEPEVDQRDKAHIGLHRTDGGIAHLDLGIADFAGEPEPEVQGFALVKRIAVGEAVGIKGVAGVELGIGGKGLVAEDDGFVHPALGLYLQRGIEQGNGMPLAKGVARAQAEEPDPVGLQIVAQGKAGTRIAGYADIVRGGIGGAALHIDKDLGGKRGGEKGQGKGDYKCFCEFHGVLSICG
jgi:hypothetical protein